MTVCDDVQIKYTGDGTTVLFSFPFEYEKQSDVYVGFLNSTTGLYDNVPSDDTTNPWSFANATTLQFTTAPADTQQFKISRTTGIDYAVFSPGSAIRAQDLNDNFDQVEMAIEEGRCADEEIYSYVDDNFLEVATDVVTLAEQVAGTAAIDNAHVFSTSASANRHDVIISPDTPSNPSQVGKIWINTITKIPYYWTGTAWVQTAQASGEGITYKGTINAVQPLSAPSDPEHGDVWVNTAPGVCDSSWGSPAAGTTIANGWRLSYNDSDQWDALAPAVNNADWAVTNNELVPSVQTNVYVPNELTVGNTQLSPAVTVNGTGVTFPDGTTQTTAAEAAPDLSGYMQKSGGTFTGGVDQTERTITASAFDLSTGNFWTCGAITVPNPTNATAGASGLIRVTAAPVGWGNQFSTPPTVASVPAIIPFYVESSSQIRLGQAVEVA